MIVISLNRATGVAQFKNITNFTINFTTNFTINFEKYCN